MNQQSRQFAKVGGTEGTRPFYARFKGSGLRQACCFWKVIQ
jgi:hypothetical protein